MLCRPGRLVRALPLAVPFLLPAGALALESGWSDSGKAQVRLMVAGTATGNPATFLRAGVEIRLERGWHTYWRHAGDAGMPPRFDWSGSDNLADAEVDWPAPVRIAVEDGIESIGYKDSVLLPLRLRPRDPARPVSVRLKLDFGMCEKICIPASSELALDVPAGGGRASPALDAAEARVPKKAAPGAAGALGVIAAKLAPGAKPAAIVDVAVPEGRPFDLFAEGPSDAWSLPLPKRESVAHGRARFVLALDDAAPAGGALPRALRLTLVSGAEAVEVVAPLD